LKKIIRRIQIGAGILALVLVAFVAAAFVFWNVMSFVVAALYLFAAGVIVILATAFGGYVIVRRSRL
jgi:hypothetical protein